MAAESEKKVFSICLFAEEKASPEQFNLEMKIMVLEDAWDQVNEMLTIAKVNNRELKFTVDGPLGTRSLKQIERLAANGSVIWRVPSAIFAAARSQTEGRKNVAVEKLDTKAA